MPMALRYVELAALPPLAWCARPDRHGESVVVVHGSGAETYPRAFMEAA
ncbi:MAG TPA: hypothetical protein VFJ24_06480 [Gaiellales bacterium]|jgi:hypothetical protein|nr:hypothetical protein [Gaiellales bacterium]